MEVAMVTGILNSKKGIPIRVSCIRCFYDLDF